MEKTALSTERWCFHGENNLMLQKTAVKRLENQLDDVDIIRVSKPELAPLVKQYG
jgi:hypothetical protein